MIIWKSDQVYWNRSLRGGVRRLKKSKIISYVLQVTHVMKVSAGRQNFSPPSAMNKKQASCLGEIQRLQRVRTFLACCAFYSVLFNLFFPFHIILTSLFYSLFLIFIFISFIVRLIEPFISNNTLNNDNNSCSCSNWDYRYLRALVLAFSRAFIII